MKNLTMLFVAMVMVIGNMFAQGSTEQKQEMAKYDQLWSCGGIVKNETAEPQTIEMSDSSGNQIRIQSLISNVNGSLLKMEVITTFDPKTNKQMRSQMKLVYGNKPGNEQVFEPGLSIVAEKNLSVTRTGNSQFQFPKLLSNGEIAIKVYHHAGTNALQSHYYYIVISKDTETTIASK